MITFKDLPDTSTPLTAENLNNNFNELNNTILQASDVKTWTPALDDATVNYAQQQGYYIKFGKMVFFWFKLRGTISSISGNAYAFISGLPYSNNYGDTSGSIFEHFNCSDNTKNILLRIAGNKVCLQSDDNGAGSGAARWIANQGTFYLGGSGFYLTNE